jgi:uncharacterized protein involved in response to NO
MIFGYALAIIVGFLFTAGRNWTNQPTPTGPALAAIAALWLIARLLVLTPWYALSPVADTAFIIAAAVGLAIPFYKDRNRRNYFFVALLLAIGAANLVFNLALAGTIDFPPQRAVQLALDLILFIMAVIGGRVIPMFTANAVSGIQIARAPWLERLALGSVLALLVLDLLGAPSPAVALGAALAAVAHALRLALWRPWRTARRPMLWILHAAYLWIAVHLLLRACAAVNLVPPSLATHALTVGAIGGLTVGMMTRTARGHTGRLLHPSRFEVAAYALVQLAAVVRVLVPLAIPTWQLSAVIVSGLLWGLAFLLFVDTFWPILTQARVDGRAS